MSSCTGLGYFKTLVRLRLLLVVSYEVCVHAKKKEKKMETGILLLEMDMTQFTLVNLEF